MPYMMIYHGIPKGKRKRYNKERQMRSLTSPVFSALGLSGSYSVFIRTGNQPKKIVKQKEKSPLIRKKMELAFKSCIVL